MDSLPSVEKGFSSSPDSFVLLDLAETLPTETEVSLDQANHEDNSEHLESIEQSEQAVVPSTEDQSRRIYVHDLPIGADPVDVRNYFNQQMHLCGLAQSEGDAVIACDIRQYSTFVLYLDFRSEEEAAAATALDGVPYKGQRVTISRPRSYFPPSAAFDPADPVSNIMDDSVSKVFISGLPQYFTDEMVKELLSSFGKLRSFNLLLDSGGISEGAAFAQYLDATLTDQAIACLNGMVLGSDQVSAVLVNSSPMESVADSDCPEDVTEVLCFKNIITEEELADYEEIVDNMREECGKYGNVKSAVALLLSEDTPPLSGFGKVFVEFETKEACSAAKIGLDGRYYAGRIVEIEYVELDKYREELT